MIGHDPILAGFWLANMGRQPGNTVALAGWGLGIKWVNKLSENIYFYILTLTLRPVVFDLSLIPDKE